MSKLLGITNPALMPMTASTDRLIGAPQPTGLAYASSGDAFVGGKPPASPKAETAATSVTARRGIAKPVIKSFRATLLDYMSEEVWRDRPISHYTFYNERLSFEGRTITGKEFIRKYVRRFPSSIEYSMKGHLYRMLDDCGIERFRFTNPDILRSFLLSAKSPQQWKSGAYVLSDFDTFTFSHHGISIKGQIFAVHLIVEWFNEENRTHYAIADYVQSSDLRRKCQGNSWSLWQRIFEHAGIDAKIYNIWDAEASPALLKEILLSAKTADEWNNWDDGSSCLRDMTFDYGLYRRFSGVTLVRIYSAQSSGDLSVKDLFAIAGISLSQDPKLIERKLAEHYHDKYAFCGDAAKIRDLLLQVYSEREWNRPKNFDALRSAPVVLDDREITLHTLMQLHSVYMYNIEQEQRTGKPSYVRLVDMQHDPDLKAYLNSNQQKLTELLLIAGITCNRTFSATLGDVNFSDENLLRSFLSNAFYQGIAMSVEEVVAAGMTMFRKIVFVEPVTGAQASGHSLMIYYSAYQHRAEYPGEPLSTIVQVHKKGQSNKSTRDNIVATAGY